MQLYINIFSNLEEIVSMLKFLFPKLTPEKVEKLSDQ